MGGKLNVGLKNWENIFKSPFMLTDDTILQSVQFKINHNILYTNSKYIGVIYVKVNFVHFVLKLRSLFSICFTIVFMLKIYDMLF